MTWTTQPCILHLLTRMVSKITSTFKMIFKSRHPFDEIHFVLRTDWLIEKLGNQRFFAITLSISKKKNREWEDRWGRRQQLLYRTMSDLCSGPLGLHEGSAILAGKVLVARMRRSVILLGKNVELFPFKFIFFRNGDKWNSTLLLDFFSRSQEPKRLKSVLGCTLVRHLRDGY